MTHLFYEIEGKIDNDRAGQQFQKQCPWVGETRWDPELKGRILAQIRFKVSYLKYY